MNLNRRLTELLKYLFIHRDPLEGRELAQHFSISERTLRSDIKSINESISNNGALIKQVRSQGYQLEVSDIELFDRYIQLQNDEGINTQELETAERRIKHLIVELLYADHYLSLESLANSVFVSHSTILNYLKTIKTLLNEYSLELTNKVNIGYKVIGDELNKRECILDMISSDITSSPVLFSQEQANIFSDIDLQLIRKTILLNGSNNGIRFSDFNLKNLILHIALMISRINNDASIEDFNLPFFDNEVKHTIDTLLLEIERDFNIKIPAGERNYIYTHFFSNSPMFISEVSNETIESLVHELLHNVYLRFGYDLQNDDILIKDLTSHLRSIMTVKYFNLNKKNPLLNMIKSNYPFEFEITLIALKETLRGKFEMFSEDEVAYIALHIGAAIERFSAKNRQKKRIMLVCGSGHATTRMIEAQLNSLFEDTMNITAKLSYNEFLTHSLNNVDLVLTTVPLMGEIDIPNIFIELPIQSTTIERIHEHLLEPALEFDLGQYFDPDLFLIQHKTTSKEAVITDLINKLNEKGLVDEQFQNSVMKRENLASTLMDSMIAIPHPMNASSIETKIAVALLDKPVIWTNNQTAQIILLLAIAEEDRNQLENLYGAFVDITNNTKVQSQILKVTCLEEFIEILHRSKQQ